MPVLAGCLATLMLVAACSGSGITGSNGVDSDALWTLGAAETTEPDGDTVGDTELVTTDVVMGGDGTSHDLPADVLESVPAPDGFPGPPTGLCVEGELCPLTLSDPCYEGRCNALGACVVVPVADCCETDDDCLAFIPQDACEQMRCMDNTCTLVSRPGCCSDQDTCDDGESCTVDDCLDGPGGRCVSCPTTCSCPDTPPLFEAHFDGQALLDEGFGVDDQQSDTVSWRLSSRRAMSPPSAAWLGEISCPTYYSGTLGPDCQPTNTLGADGGVVRASLIGPAVALPTSPGGHVASFWLWSDVEALGSGGADERDVLTVTVYDVVSGEGWPVTSSLWVGKHTQGQWRQMAIDLSPWMGTTVSLRFLFDTLDSQDNHHEGVYLDDIVISPRCASGCCTVDADCQTPSGADACVAHRCLGLSDGSMGTCLPAPTTPGVPCTTCATDTECTDANPCTADLCGDDGLCTHTAFCCIEITAFATGFEDGLLGWYVIDGQPDDGVTWSASETSAAEGTKSAWLGNPFTGTYAGDGAVVATLRSPMVTVPDGGDDLGEAAIRFALSLSTEWDGELYDNLTGLDRLRLEVSVGGGAGQEIWSSDEIGGTTGGDWTEIEVSLAPWRGQSVQLSFTFDTVDEAANDHDGPRIDDLRIGHVCP